MTCIVTGQWTVNGDSLSSPHRQVDREIVNILRQRWRDCAFYEGVDAPKKCVELQRISEEAETNFFIKCESGSVIILEVGWRNKSFQFLVCKENLEQSKQQSIKLSFSASKLSAHF